LDEDSVVWMIRTMGIMMTTYILYCCFSLLEKYLQSLSSDEMEITILFYNHTLVVIGVS
jgi:hypothetical protein